VVAKPADKSILEGIQADLARMTSFLVIQTAFLGDVILATPIVEKLHAHFPDAQIDFLLRRGNEGLLTDHPFIRSLLIWDKRKGKYGNLMKIARTVRANRYDYVINCHRFASSGLITALSKATDRIGFDKNPFST
jgi:heptosyltransferase-2